MPLHLQHVLKIIEPNGTCIFISIQLWMVSVQVRARIWSMSKILHFSIAKSANCRGYVKSKSFFVQIKLTLKFMVSLNVCFPSPRRRVFVFYARLALDTETPQPSCSHSAAVTTMHTTLSTSPLLGSVSHRPSRLVKSSTPPLSRVPLSSFLSN